MHDERIQGIHVFGNIAKDSCSRMEGVSLVEGIHKLTAHVDAAPLGKQRANATPHGRKHADAVSSHLRHEFHQEQPQVRSCSRSQSGIRSPSMPRSFHESSTTVPWSTNSTQAYDGYEYNADGAHHFARDPVPASAHEADEPPDEPPFTGPVESIEVWAPSLHAKPCISFDEFDNACWLRRVLPPQVCEDLATTIKMNDDDVVGGVQYQSTWQPGWNEPTEVEVKHGKGTWQPTHEAVYTAKTFSMEVTTFNHNPSPKPALCCEGHSCYYTDGVAPSKLSTRKLALGKCESAGGRSASG